MPRTRPIPIRLGTISNVRNLRAEQNHERKSWMIWLHANNDFTLGTFIELHNDGRIDRVIWLEDGSEDIFNIRGD